MKKEKESLIYRFVDQDLKPVSIKTGWGSFSARLGRMGKIYKGKAYAISGLRRWISHLKTDKSKKFQIQLHDGNSSVTLNREDALSWLMTLKLEIFRISEQKDVLFYLDEIYKG